MKKAKLYLVVAVSAIAIVFILDVVLSVKKGYKSDFELHKNYEYFLIKKPKPIIGDFYGFAWTNKLNTLNEYHYPRGCYTYLWDLQELKDIKLDSIFLLNRKNLSGIKINKGQILNSESSSPITIKNPLDIKNKLFLNLSNGCKVDELIKGENYVGFSGKVAQMSISNKYDEHQILFSNYSGLKPTTLIFYKSSESTFLIIVQTKSMDAIINKKVLDFFKL